MCFHHFLYKYYVVIFRLLSRGMLNKPTWKAKCLLSSLLFICTKIQSFFKVSSLSCDWILFYVMKTNLRFIASVMNSTVVCFALFPINICRRAGLNIFKLQYIFYGEGILVSSFHCRLHQRFTFPFLLTAGKYQVLRAQFTTCLPSWTDLNYELSFSLFLKQKVSITI